jgi:hypothetical protein
MDCGISAYEIIVARDTFHELKQVSLFVAA